MSTNPVERIWAYCKRNATSRNAIIHYRTNRKSNWNIAILRVRVNNWKSRWNNIATLTLKLNSMKITMNNTKPAELVQYSNTLKLIKNNDFIISFKTIESKINFTLNNYTNLNQNCKRQSRYYNSQIYSKHGYHFFATLI